MPVIDVPDALRDRLGPEGTKALVSLFNQAARETRDDVIVVAEERFRRHVADELRGVETRFEARLGALAQRIAAVESRLIRWCFVFWATLMAALFLRT